MRLTQFSLVISSFKTGIVVVGLCFQMLPFLLLLVVIAYSLGVSGKEALVIFPVFFLVMVFAACCLASKRTRRVPTRPPPKLRRTAKRPVRDVEVLLKTRAERYQDLKEIMMGGRP